MRIYIFLQLHVTVINLILSFYLILFIIRPLTQEEVTYQVTETHQKVSG